MKEKLKEFINLYIEQSGDIKLITEIIINDDNNFYNESQDIQLMDVSFEYEPNNFTYNKEFRFSYFGTHINFLDKIESLGLIDNLFILKDNYAKYHDSLKDNFVTISFIFKDFKLVSLKLYFDIDISKLKTNNFILSKFREKLDEKIVLVSLTLKNNNIVEEKFYFALNSYTYVYSSKFLKYNDSFANYKKYIPFEVLFREDGLGKLKSIKYYYKDITKNTTLYQDFRKIFPDKIINNGNLNIKEEFGVDFGLKSGVNKWDYYIGLYK